VLIFSACFCVQEKLRECGEAMAAACGVGIGVGTAATSADTPVTVLGHGHYRSASSESERTVDGKKRCMGPPSRWG
jgi:cyclin D6